MRNLPVIAAFTHAVRSVRNNIAFAFTISWPVYAALIPIVLGGTLLIHFVSGGDPRNAPFAVSALSAIMAFATLVAFSIIAVRWHRYILRDELPAGKSPLALEPEAWRYTSAVIALVLMVFAMILAVATVLALLSFGSGTVNPLLIVLATASALVIGVVVMRLSVRLPAIALGRTDFGFSDAWQATTRNNGAFLGFTLLNSVVVIGAGLAAEAVGAGLAQLGSGLGLALGVLIQLAANWIVTMFSSSVLTSLYGFFVEGRDF